MIHPRAHSEPFRFLSRLTSLTACQFFSTEAFAQKPEVAHTLTDLGGLNSFSPSLATRADLERLFAESRADLLEVLGKAGWEGEAEDLFAAVAAGEVSEIGFPVGDELRWMAYRRGGRVDVTGRILWAGEAPFEAFEIRFPSNGWHWRFIVPKVCGNRALDSRKGTSEVVVAVTSGVIELTKADGGKVVLHAGESEVLEAPGLRPGEERTGEADVETWFEVGEGKVEFHDYEGTTTVFLEEGNTIGASIQPDRRLALAVPESNDEALAIRTGDAVGTVSPGSSMGVDWPAPVCTLSVAPAEVCAGEPVVLDANASSVRRGVVTSVEVELTRPDGGRETLVPETPRQFRWSRSYDAPGTYTARAAAIGQKDKRSTNECAATFEVKSCEPPKPPPPTCDLALSADDVDPFDELAVDATASRSEGELARVEVEVTGPDGASVLKEALPATFTTSVVPARGGVYAVKAVAVDVLGQTSEACEATFDVYPLSSFAGSILAGCQERLGVYDAAVLGFKGGLRRILGPGLEVVASLGGLHDLDDDDASALFGELELNWDTSGRRASSASAPASGTSRTTPRRRSSSTSAASCRCGWGAGRPLSCSRDASSRTTSGRTTWCWWAGCASCGPDAAWPEPRRLAAGAAATMASCYVDREDRRVDSTPPVHSWRVFTLRRTSGRS